MRISDWSSDVCSSDLNREGNMRSTLRFVSVAAVTAMLAAVPGSAQKTTGPKERYEMDVATASGFAAMAAGGRKPGVGSVMGMMFGGDRKSVVEGKRVSVRGDLGGRHSIKKTKKIIE